MKEALKQIVDLLQPVAALADGTPFEHSEVIQRCVDASEIALEALAQPAQEPVGKWMGKEVEWTDNPHKFRQGQHIYTTPQQRPWVGLTHQETKDCMKAWEGNDAYVLCRAIEAKLKEKNND
jgi:hypothetical protein